MLNGANEITGATGDHAVYELGGQRFKVERTALKDPAISKDNPKLTAWLKDQKDKGVNEPVLTAAVISTFA